MATTGTGQTGSAADRRPAENIGSGNTGGDGQGIAQTLRDTTYRGLDNQKARASETLGSLAGAVRGMTQPLKDGGQAGVADYVNKAADGIERWASQLRQQDLDDAMRGVQQFARRQPALFLGIAFTAGIVAARFLKSSADDYDEQYGSWGGGGGTMGNVGRRTGVGSNIASADLGAQPFGTTTSGDIPRLSSDIRSTGEVI